MTDRRIIFSAPMVRALLDGRKTMTRRLAWKIYRLQYPDWPGCAEEAERKGWRVVRKTPGFVDIWRPTIWQKVRPGDRLWVRETWAVGHYHGAQYGKLATWKASPWHIPDRWHPSIFMPRWASRLTLVVTETKLERVQDISVDDAWAEGVERRSKKVRQMWLYGASEGERSDIYRRAAKWEFQDLWNTLHKPGNRWEDNPEVVAISFTAHKTNIDRLEAAKQ